MKSKIAAFALAATMMTQVAAFADDAMNAPADANTSLGKAAWSLLSLPVNVGSAVGSGAVGAVGGGLKGIIATEEKFSDATYAKVNENPLLLPVGLVGTAVAVPVGFLTGMPYGVVHGVHHGWNLLNHMGSED